MVRWIRFLQVDCPSRKTLSIMGLKASTTPYQSLDQAAAAYVDIIRRVHSGVPTGAAIA